MSSKHYEKAHITPQMVGKVLDVALLCHVAGTPAMGLQAAKKIIYTKRNSGKTRIQELNEAIKAIEKMIEFEELDLMTESEQGFPEIEAVGANHSGKIYIKSVDSNHGCAGCMFDGIDSRGLDCIESGACKKAENETGMDCNDGFIYVLEGAE